MPSSTPAVYTLSLHDALPISEVRHRGRLLRGHRAAGDPADHHLHPGPHRREEGELRGMSALTVDNDPLGTMTGDSRNTGRARGPRRPLWLSALLMTGVLTTISVFSVPIYWLFSSALKPHSDIYSWPLQWLPLEVTFGNFVEAWKIGRAHV